MSSLTLTVTVEPFGERFMARVARGAFPDEHLASTVRDGEREAVEVALTLAAADVAAGLCPLRPRAAAP